MSAPVEFESLGELPTGWRWQKLQDLAADPRQDIVDGPFGSNLKASEYVDRGVPIARLQNVDRNQFIDKNIRCVTEAKAAELARHRFQPGDILLTKLGDPLGKACIVPPAIGGGVIVADLVRIRPDPGEVDRQYLTYALNSPTVIRQLERHTKGTTRPRVNLGVVRELPIPVAPRDEQESVVAEIEKQFSRLDEAVANLKRVKVNLKRQTAAILSAAIGGELFERASLPADADRPEFAPAIDLPSGWSWVSTAEVCEVVASGSTPKPDEMTSGAGEVPFIKVYNLGFDGSLDFTVKPTFIRRAIHEGALARSRCLPGDVLMNIVGPPLGKVSLVPEVFPEWNINQAIVTFRAGPQVLNRLLAYWLMAPPAQRRIERTAKATAGQYNVQVSTCRKLVLPLPPLDEQYRIVTEVDRRLSIVREVEAEVDANLSRALFLKRAVLARSFCS